MIPVSGGSGGPDGAARDQDRGLIRGVDREAE